MAEFNYDILKEQTLARMGIENVPVEIGEEGLDACRARTLEILGRYKPNLRHESYVTSVGVTVHECKEDVQGVTTVDLTPTNAGSIGTMNIESAMLSGQPVFYSTTDTYLDIQYFDERLRWIKTAQRVLSSDPDYAIVRDDETTKILVYTYGSVPLWVDVLTIVPYNDELTNIPLHLQNWLADYFRAEVMEVVSRVRGKFDKIPVAGGFMSLDGPRMYDEAQKEKARLLEFIQGSRSDLFPRWA